MEVGIFFDNLREAFSEPPDDCALLECAAQAGADYVEMDWEQLQHESAEFLLCLERCGLGLAVYAFTDEHGLLRDGTRIADILPCLASLGVPALMAVCGSELPESADKAAAEREILAVIRDLCSRASEYGMTVLFEDFDGKRIPCGSCADLLRFGDAVPGLRFTFDTGNFAFFGEDVCACFDRLSDRIAHVHVKDRVSDSDLRVTETGNGGLPLRYILHRLAQTGYDGRLTAEMFGAVHSMDSIRRALAFIRTFMQQYASDG